MTEDLLLVFVDSNVVVSVSRSADSPLRRLWELPGVGLLTSAHSIGEIRRHCETLDQQGRFEELLSSMRVVPDRPDLQLPIHISLPPKDIPIYLAAMGAGADYLITGDRKIS